MSRRAKHTTPIESEDDGQDPLAVINAELREQDAPEDDPDSPWLPLESNPVRCVYLCLVVVDEGYRAVVAICRKGSSFAAAIS
jgi:hypothetical protein